MLNSLNLSLVFMLKSSNLCFPLVLKTLNLCLSFMQQLLAFLGMLLALKTLNFSLPYHVPKTFNLGLTFL